LQEDWERVIKNKKAAYLEADANYRYGFICQMIFYITAHPNSNFMENMKNIFVANFEHTYSGYFQSNSRMGRMI